MRIYMAILLLILFAACCNKTDITDNVDAIKLIHRNFIREGNTIYGMKQTVDDTLDIKGKQDRESLLKALEDKRWEPMKVFPKYKIEIIYKNKHKEYYGVNGHAVVSHGRTYKIDMNLEEWIKNKFIQAGRLHAD